MTYTIATVDNRTAGFLPLFRTTAPAFTAPIFNPAVLAPDIFPVDHPASDYLLIGGNQQLVAGASVRADLDEQLAAQVAGALVDRAMEHAHASRLVPAALYVRDRQLPAFLGTGVARRATAVDKFASLPLPGRTDEDYLASLSPSSRATVRRDWRSLDALGLRAQVIAAQTVVREAAPLVAALKARHGVPDHPRLIEMRLMMWAREEVGERIAFTVRDERRQLLSVSFGCHRGEVLEMNEGGLADDIPVRRLAYAESLIYAPIRYAMAADCREIQLGTGSSESKSLRGAELAPVWVVGEGTQA